MVRSFTLWQGPPGTGKTATLLALVSVLVSTARGPFAATAAAAGRGPSALDPADRAAAAATAADRWQKMGCVLATANTNAATDNLLEGLAARGVSVVRVGQPAKVRESLRHLSLEALAEATDDGRRAVELRRTSKVGAPFGGLPFGSWPRSLLPAARAVFAALLLRLL
jgi:regulator of nonsense transcripts 1